MAPGLNVLKDSISPDRNSRVIAKSFIIARQIHRLVLSFFPTFTLLLITIGRMTSTN